MSKLGDRCICDFCDFQGSGTCIIEAAKTGHYGTQPTDAQQLKAEIAALVNNYPTDSWKYDSDRVNSLLAALRQLSAV